MLICHNARKTPIRDFKCTFSLIREQRGCPGATREQFRRKYYFYSKAICFLFRIRVFDFYHNARKTPIRNFYALFP